MLLDRAEQGVTNKWLQMSSSLAKSADPLEVCHCHMHELPHCQVALPMNDVSSLQAVNLSTRILQPKNVLKAHAPMIVRSRL